MGVGEWVRDLAITLRVLETSYPYNVFPIAKIVGQARRLGLPLKRNKFVVSALNANRALFIYRRVSRYTFFGLSKEGREYADIMLGTTIIPTGMGVMNSIPYRVRLLVTYKFPVINIVCRRTHNIVVDVAFMKGDYGEEHIVEPIDADSIHGVIRVIDKGFEYEAINLAIPPKSEKPILNKYPIIWSMYKFVILHPKQAYSINPKFAKTLLYTLALRPELLNAEIIRKHDTVIIKYAGRKLCCECVDPEVCIHI